MWRPRDALALIEVRPNTIEPGPADCIPDPGSRVNYRGETRANLLFQLRGCAGARFGVPERDHEADGRILGEGDTVG